MDNIRAVVDRASVAIIVVIVVVVVVVVVITIVVILLSMMLVVELVSSIIRTCLYDVPPSRKGGSITK